MKYTLPRSCSLATMCYPLFGKYRVLLKEKTRASIDLQAEAATSPRQELTCQLIKIKVRNFHCVVNGHNVIIDPTNDNFLRRQKNY